MTVENGGDNSMVVDKAAEKKSDIINGSVSITHYESLIGELRCPSCAKPMESPLLLCSSGHSICERCTKMLRDCPLCHKSFTQIRARTVETLAAKAHFNCSNALRGCTVRLPVELLKWHEETCVYQIGDCFMGKVWGKCMWSGCEIDWIDHCIENHKDKLWLSSEMQHKWHFNIEKNLKPVCGYFIIQTFNETFNLYQIVDKSKKKVIWTLVCAAKNPSTARQFAFELEMFAPSDPTRLLVQRHCCHGERDNGILNEGRCASFGFGDIMRFLDKKKILHYRVKVLQIDTLSLSSQLSESNNQLTIDDDNIINTTDDDDSINNDKNNVDDEYYDNIKLKYYLKNPLTENKEEQSKRPLLDDKNVVRISLRDPAMAIDSGKYENINNDNIAEELKKLDIVKKVLVREYSIGDDQNGRVNVLPKPARLHSVVLAALENSRNNGNNNVM